MYNIYKYNNDFDKDIICDKLVQIEEQIQDEKEDNSQTTEQRNTNIRRLMYEQLIQGLRLNTGYRYF